MATFIINGRELSLTRPLVYKFTDPVRGEVYQPLEVAPPITVTIDKNLYLFSSNQVREVKVKLKTQADNAKGFVSLKAPAGWNITPANKLFELPKAGDETTVSFSVAPASSNMNAATDTLKATVEMNGQSYNRSKLTISYDYIPTITIYPPAAARLVSVPLTVKGKNIGYIKGAGDFVPDMLRELGYK
jgi:hypothetical protein